MLARIRMAGLGAAVALGVVGCTGATLGSGVGDAQLERAPYYAGRGGVAAGAVAFLPIGYQPEATRPPTFDPARGTAVGVLLDSMNAFLDRAAAGVLAGRVSAPAGTPPDVQFGCLRDGLDECVALDELADGVRGPGRPVMRLAVGRPSRDWAAAAGGVVASAGADALLILTLEPGDYWPRQTNWRGSKAVDLGSGHTVPLPWLTSLETPISVLQLTGALVGRDGKAIRIGAEGLLARRTPLLAAGFGAQALIRDDDVEALLTERREDLPGRPLVWEAAILALLDALTDE